MTSAEVLAALDEALAETRADGERLLIEHGASADELETWAARHEASAAITRASAQAWCARMATRGGRALH